MQRLPRIRHWILQSAALACLAFLTGCSRPVPPDEPVRAVRTLTLAESTAMVRLEFAGEVRARTESRLGFRVGGKMLHRDVELGAVVRAGQRLARLDPQDLQWGQTGAQAALASAQADLTQAEADFRRFTELRDQGFISPAELERRETTLKAARARVVQSRAEAAVQGNQTGYATLAADVGGVVTAVEAEPGQVLGAGQTVLRLAVDGPRDVVFSVPEDKLAMVKALVGRAGALQVRLWGESRLLLATVREVAAATDPATRTLLVKADVGRAAVTLGQTATVLLRFPQPQAAIRLPMSALLQSGGQSSVWLLDAAKMTVKLQAVEIGGAEGNMVLIAGGLRPGQEVVTAGVHVLTAGQTVRRYGAEPQSGPASAADAASGPAPSAASSPAAAAASNPAAGGSAVAVAAPR